LLSFIAIVVGVMITMAVLPSFNNLAGKSLTLPFDKWWLVPGLLAASLFIGVVAGIYPSFYLSAFRPAKVLKGTGTSGRSRATLRSSLVIFQFTISTILIAGTLVVNEQMDYILNKKLGFEKDQVLVLDGVVTLGENVIPLKNELTQLADVQAVSITGYLPVEGAKRNHGPHWRDGSNADEGIGSQQWSVDHDYVKAMGLNIMQGRDFSMKINSDSQAMIVNEAFVSALGLKDPVGQTVHNYYGAFTVIGVVEDFHFESMKENITPVCFFVRKDRKTMAVKVRSTDMNASIEAITGVWKKFSPHQPIRVNFLDDQYARMYNDVSRFQTVLTVFTSLAIVVACLGLFALSAFMIEQRGKEISIRLVLGAPMTHVLRLLSQNFMTLISISFAIATPVAWYLMNKWLQDYAYKIDISWRIFAVTGISALAIALVTIGYQSIKASITNPVVNLKSE
jgi:putative ABC transport system permease protein